MPGLSPTAIQDLVASTLRDLGPMRMTLNATDLRDFPVMQDMLKKDKVAFDGGIGIERSIWTERGNSVKQTKLHGEDSVSIVDVIKKVRAEWKYTTFSYAWERRELLHNRGNGKKILDLIKLRRNIAMLDLAHHWEDQFWTLADPADDEAINGLPFWVVKNATEGLNGGTPVGYSTAPGGLEHPKWKNHTFTYKAITKIDALAAMRRAGRATRFKSPISIQDFRSGTGARFKIFVNYNTVDEMEMLLEEQNDNLGTDLWKYDGSPTFRKSPIIAVDKLNADTTDPIYMLDMSQFYPVFLEGDYMTETEPTWLQGRHNTLVVNGDCTVNWLCNDRRVQAVGYRN